MQISRHWRLNANRYRLEGVRYENGAVSLQERPATQSNRQNLQGLQAIVESRVEKKAVTVA